MIEVSVKKLNGQIVIESIEGILPVGYLLRGLGPNVSLGYHEKSTLPELYVRLSEEGFAVFLNLEPVYLKHRKQLKKDDVVKIYLPHSKRIEITITSFVHVSPPAAQREMINPLLNPVAQKVLRRY